VAAISAVVGTIGVALAAPAGFTPGWIAPAVDLTATALLIAAVLWRRPHEVVRAVAAIGIALLPGHAVVDSADSAPELAYTLGGLLVIGVVTAVVGRWRDRIAGAVAVAVIAPLVVALGGAIAWAAHSDVIHVMALTAAGLPLAVWAVRRWYPRVADLAARATVLVTMLIAVLVPGDTWSKSVYVAGAAVALAILPRTGMVERIAGWAVLGIGLIAAQPPLVVVLVPYGSLISDVAYPAVALAEVIAVAVLTAALWSNRPLLYSALPVPVALALVHFGLTWPWLPLALLAAGLALVAYAVRRSPWCAPFGLLLAGSGLSGLSVEYWSLITGLSVVCAAALAFAWFSRIRVPSWIVFALAWLGLAQTSARAAGLPDRGLAFTILAAAALLLLASVVLPRPRSDAAAAESDTGAPARKVQSRADARVLEIPAHLAALGVIVAVPSAARLSEACLVWGIALGLSVLPRLKAPGRLEWLLRLGFAGVLEITALWALLISRDVQAVEAYSLPLAGVALIVGFLAMRRDPTLTSWIGYGPALVAAFGPSLAVILPVPGDPWRRLGLGIAALVVVVAGSVRRRQAPVVIGGAVLIVVALHEVTQVWSKLPLWLPIGVGGAILVGLAITYERRLRDLRTLRSRISSFS
jgi:hypothetical protein